MTNKLTLALALFSTAFSIADELSISQAASFPTTPQVQTAPISNDSMKKGTVYFRAITDSQPTNDLSVLPGFGFGYRRAFGASGIDATFNVNYRNSGSIWTFPRVSYLNYISPNADQSLYTGIGLGWGGTHNRESDRESDFVGLIPHATFGYEMFRNATISSFTEFTVSHPLIPAYSHGSFPGPVAELSVGAGF